MNILQERTYNGEQYCISHIWIDGQYFCDAIEDVDRGLDQSMTLQEIKLKKVYAQTAIPTGTYVLTMDVQSPKYAQRPFYRKFCKGYMPRLLNVPGYDGILIHPGTNHRSTAGCIIVGYNKHKGTVERSAHVWIQLMEKYLMPAGKRKEDINYTITRKFKPIKGK